MALQQFERMSQIFLTLVTLFQAASPEVLFLLVTRTECQDHGQRQLAFAEVVAQRLPAAFRFRQIIQDIVHDLEGRRGQALNSLVAGGVIISGSVVRSSVLARRVRLHSHSLVERSILFDNVTVGRNCEIRNAIIDKGVTVPDGTQIGVNLDDDRARGFTVTATGVVAVPKGYRFDQRS